MTAVSNLQTALENAALLSLEKQQKLAWLLGEYTHELDLDAGMVRFSTGIEVSCQILGTESDNTLTWLWAWSEEQTELPTQLLSSAFKLKDWGEREGIREFAHPSFDISRIDGHAIALISAQVCGASCFLQDEYEGGAAYFLLFDQRIDSQPSFDRALLFRHFSDLIARHDLNHRNALLAYLQQKGLAPREQDLVITCGLSTGEILSAAFDNAGMLVDLQGEPFTR